MIPVSLRLLCSRRRLGSSSNVALAGGFVHYVPREQAQQLVSHTTPGLQLTQNLTHPVQNLTYASSNTAILRVDTSVGPGSEPDASTGRFSVRATSRNTYNNGLFIFDVRHTPYGCGTWPALWLSDPYNWPDHGEIDVMEAVNQADEGNQMTLHTTRGCTMNVRRRQTGHAEHDDCDHARNANRGCDVSGPEDSYGEAFNGNGGGIMALEWRDAGIRMWQFARSAIPADIASRNPNPATWGTAAADFPSTNCDIGSMFRNNSIIINITLCGDWVYSVWDESGCKNPPFFRVVFSDGRRDADPDDRPERLPGLCGEQPGCFHQRILGAWPVRGVSGSVEHSKQRCCVVSCMMIRMFS